MPFFFFYLSGHKKQLKLLECHLTVVNSKSGTPAYCLPKAQLHHGISPLYLWHELATGAMHGEPAVHCFLRDRISSGSLRHSASLARVGDGMEVDALKQGQRISVCPGSPRN